MLWLSGITDKAGRKTEKQKQESSLLCFAFVNVAVL